MLYKKFTLKKNEKLVWGVLDIEEIREKDNETGLKEGGGIEMSIYSAFPYTRLHSLSFAFEILYLILVNSA